jgi:anaerobic selenocysteine-containing dehydrogenase
MEKLTSCTLNCPDACSLLVSRDPEGSWSLRGNPRHPITAGFVCHKVRRHIDRLMSPDRILSPLLRGKGSWRTIGWDAALDICAEKIQALRRHPLSILHIPGDGAKGVLKKTVPLFFAQLGSTSVRGSLCDEAGIAAGALDFGSRRNHRLEDLYKAERVVNWGRDLGRSAIHVAAMIHRVRRKGVKVLTISPGGDGNGRFCDERIRIRPGTDRFLALAVIRRLYVHGAIDGRILQRVHGWEDFENLVKRQDENDLCRACDITPETVGRLAAWYSADRPTATLIGGGLQRYRYGGETVRFINALTLLAGQIGRSGGGSYFHLNSLERFNLTWARPSREAALRSLLLADIGAQIAAAANPPIELLWVNGTNIVNQGPDSRTIARSFAKVPFKVVVDAFFNDTVERADLVLPAALMFEQEDVIGSYGHEFVHYVAKLTAPPGEARCDSWIVRELGRRLNPIVSIPEDEVCLQESLSSPFLKITLTELRERGFTRTIGPEVAYGGLRFDHADGLARLPDELHAEAPVPEHYPLRLLSIVNGRIMQSQIPRSIPNGPPTVWVAPQNPVLKRLGADRTACLISPIGRLRVKVESLADLHPHAVIYRRGDWMAHGGGINQIIAGGVGDLGENAMQYEQYVAIQNG